MWWRATLTPVIRLRWILISWGFLVILSACAVIFQQNEWIMVGQTTREEVVEAYGEPDFVMEAAEGETVVYRPIHLSRSVPPLEIPKARAGPRGVVTTQMEPIYRGSSTPALRGRPDRELRIRYDVHGIVRELVR